MAEEKVLLLVLEFIIDTNNVIFMNSIAWCHLSIIISLYNVHLMS